MATQKPLVIDTGTVQQIVDADTLLVGVAVEPSTGTALRIGDAAGTTTTTFPGPVRLDGDVTTVGGTTFTTDATFEGNVTFGDGPADTVSFAATTTVVSDINFATPVAYKITNLANGVNPNDAVNVSQLSALVTGVSSFQTSLSGLTPSSATGGAITLAGTLGVTSGGTGTTTQFTQGSVVFAGASGVYAQDNASLFFDDGTNSLGIRTATPNEALTVSGVVSVGEGSAPSATAAFGKLWANSAADARPYWTDDTGQSFNLTLDRFNTLTPAASVAIDTDPALPVFNSLALDQNTTFTTSNLGNGRSASVRVIGDASTRTLTFPGGWTWLGSGPPADLAAGDVGYLSITAYGTADADVVAAWSYENQPAVVTGSGTATRVAFWNGTSTLSSDANLYWDDTNNRLGVGTATPTTAIDLASGQLAIPDGTAAAPAIAFRDDLNTGIFSPSNDIVGVAVNGTEVARLQQSGAGSTPVLLMGTSTVYGAISVDGSDASGITGTVLLGHVNAGTVLQESYRGGQFAGVRSRGTKAAPTQIGAGDGMVNVLGAGWTATGGINYGAMMTMKAEQAFTSTASGGRIEFHTTTNGTDGFTTLGSATTERMRITNAGNVGIGTATPAAKLDVQGGDALINSVKIGVGAGSVNTNTALGRDALNTNTTGNGLTAVGRNALFANSTGVDLTAVGFNALTANTGSFNTGVGSGALESNTSGTRNTSVGRRALANSVTANDNTAVGQDALRLATAGANTAVGALALDANTTGTRQVAVGYNTLGAVTTAADCTAVGHNALAVNTAAENTAVGSGALDVNTTGTRQVAVGYNALGTVTTSADCTAVGHSALASATGSSNTALGASAATATTTGNSNVAVGKSALAANVIGSSNVAIGANALATANTSGSVAIGTSALTTVTTAGNVAIGNLAAASLTTGANTTVLGNQALLSATTASDNTAIGDRALVFATGGSNTALGSGAINSLTTGNGNIGIGVGVLTAATTSINNVAIGNSALGAQVGGGQNVGVGTNALANNTANSNTAIGNQAALANTTGTTLVAVGASALATNTTAANCTGVGANALSTSTGASNTAIGSSAGSTVTTGSNLTLVGFNAQPNFPTSTNQITLGDVAVTQLRCAVNTITLISDQRDKADIQDLALGLDFLKTVHPVQFKWDRREWYDDGVSDGSKKQDKFEPGFIAQELDAAQTAAGAEWMALTLKDNPDRWEATPLRLFPVVVKAAQELAAKAAAAEARADAAEARLAALEAAIIALQSQ